MKTVIVMKFISPFGVATSMNMVIFIKLTKYGHENPGGAQELKTVETQIQTLLFEVVSRRLRGAIQESQLSKDRSGLGHHSL